MGLSNSIKKQTDQKLIAKFSSPEFSLEWIVWMEMKENMMITTWCQNLICNYCTMKVKRWPYTINNILIFYNDMLIVE